MAKSVPFKIASHVFTAVVVKDDEVSTFTYCVIEGVESDFMSIKDAVRELEENGYFIRSSETRPVRYIGGK